jgi:hypothetical protein
MALGKLARAKSLPQTKNRGQPLTLTVTTRFQTLISRRSGAAVAITTALVML